MYHLIILEYQLLIKYEKYKNIYCVYAGGSDPARNSCSDHILLFQ